MKFLLLVNWIIIIPFQISNSEMRNSSENKASPISTNNQKLWHRDFRKENIFKQFDTFECDFLQHSRLKCNQLLFQPVLAVVEICLNSQISFFKDCLKNTI